MVEKIKEVSSVETTNDYAELISAKVLPQTGKLLVYLKEENTHAVLFKIQGAQDESFVYAEELVAETLLAKNGGTSRTVNVPGCTCVCCIRLLWGVRRGKRPASFRVQEANITILWLKPRSQLRIW